MPNIISLPHGKCPPLHLQGPSWRHLLKLMAMLSGTRLEATVEAMAVSKTEMQLRTVVQFVKVCCSNMSIFSNPRHSISPSVHRPNGGQYSTSHWITPPHGPGMPMQGKMSTRCRTLIASQLFQHFSAMQLILPSPKHTQLYHQTRFHSPHSPLRFQALQCIYKLHWRIRGDT
jgi:hypothetical protein